MVKRLYDVLKDVPYQGAVYQIRNNLYPFVLDEEKGCTSTVSSIPMSNTSNRIVWRVTTAPRTVEYFWGPDKSGTEQGAGNAPVAKRSGCLSEANPKGRKGPRVAGLLYLMVDGAIYIPCYDNNGNVTRYVDANGITVATNVYDAFGRTISQSGPLADVFRHRFSSKYFDSKTELYYYGYRFYSLFIGRWMTQDPLGEEECSNLYVITSNNILSNVDPLGLRVWSGVASTKCKTSDIDAAARAVLDRAVQMMRSSNPMVEYYGNLCCACVEGMSKVIVTGPVGGQIIKRRIGRNAIQETPVSWPDDPSIKCPGNAQRVGYYHTHIWSGNFSKNDLDVLENRDHPYYLSQDGKIIRKAFPRRTDNPVQVGLPASANSPDGFPYPPYDIVIFQ